MDREQAARWAAAQEGVPVGADLVAAALRQLGFLAAVDRRRWLYEGPLLDRAIRRYKACWLPLLAKHTKTAVVDGPLVVPLDCEWIWHCHRLNPVQYIRDCKKVYGRILNNDNVESSTRTKSTVQSEKVWKELYPEEPFQLEFTSSSDTAMDVNPEAADDITYDLVSAVKRQSSFYYQVGTPTMHDPRFLEEALARYKGFLYLIKINQEKGMQRFCVPTYDVDLMWHTHQLQPVIYRNDMVKLLGKVLEHDDTDADRSEGKKLDVGFTGTTEQFESTFGVRYWKAGCMYRGNTPSPVTSTPQMFSTAAGNVSDICKAQKDLNALEVTVVELYLKIVDIKNLPSSVQKETVYIWFTKNQSDMFISDGGRLDISTVTGKNTGVSLQCEPAGELSLAVIVDRASKKPETIGKVSIPLHDLTGPDSKLSFERWFELKGHGGHATSSPLSLRVAASATVPSSAPKVFRMVRMEPFSIKTCLLPHSIKDQKMSSWTRFLYDCGTELIRLQIREHKAKNGKASVRELVGLSKSTKQQFQLAEFKENKWTLKVSSLSLCDGSDGSILDLKGDNQLIKLYRGRKLEYELRCCSAHSEDFSAVTAVKFCAEHPYGKAVALLDTKSQIIMVNEDWFLLPWIAISFLSVDADAEDGAKLIGGDVVQKHAVSSSDATMVVSETRTVGAGSVASAPAECGSDKAMADRKAGRASSGAVVASGENGQRESAGCGGGCSGSCGPVVVEGSKADDAKSGGCGSGCGGGCGALFKASSTSTAGEGQAKQSAGCGSGCSGACGSGTALVEISKTSLAKSGGCGGGCAGGGGCGTLPNSNAMGQAESAGCGSAGCGGGCGNGGVVLESSSEARLAKSGGCGGGSGCGGGGGCGALLSSSTAAGQGQGQSESGGCGSGCGGGGCGGGSTVVEGSKGRSGGCGGGGCGGGCGSGCGAMFSADASTKSGGGCGGGCGGGGCGAALDA